MRSEGYDDDSRYARYWLRLFGCQSITHSGCHYSFSVCALLGDGYQQFIIRPSPRSNYSALQVSLYQQFFTLDILVYPVRKRQGSLWPCARLSLTGSGD